MTDALEKPPNLSEVAFLFNDASNQLVQFQLKDYGEYMDGYLPPLRVEVSRPPIPKLLRETVFSVSVLTSVRQLTSRRTNSRFSLRVM
jgi:hypothetical protein